MSARLRLRGHRRASLMSVALGLFCVVFLAPSAAATHDDYGLDTVILHGRPGQDQVEVVYPADADHEAVMAEVRQFAEERGIALDDVRADDNLGPDTVRVKADLALGARQGPLQYVVPVSVVEPWRAFFPEGHVHLSVPDRAVVEGSLALEGDLVDPTTEVTYRLPVWTVVGPLALAITGVLLAFVLLRYFARRTASRADSPEVALHRIQRLSALVAGLGPLAVAGAMFLVGGLRWPETLVAEAVPGLHVPGGVRSVLALLGFLVPIVAVVVAAVVAVAPVDRELRRTDQSTRSAVAMNLRVMALTLFPMVLFIVGFQFLPGGSVWIMVSAVGLLAMTLLVLGPFLMKTVLPTGRISGPLRERLLAQCRVEGLRVRDVVVLDTRGGRVANAAISGVLPGLRFIFLTDHALQVLDEEELSAVLSHEIGHGREHHLLLKLATVLALIGTLAAAFALGGEALFATMLDVLPPMTLLFVAPLLAFLGVLLIQGFLGIQLEKRADDYAARAVGAAALASALDTLADANFATRRTGKLWNLLQQHPGLEQRIERLSTRGTTKTSITDDDISDEPSSAKED